MPSVDKFLFSLVDRRHYESLGAYHPETSLLTIARELLPQGWTVTRNGTWFHCQAGPLQIPPQGWKIHVSATPKNAAEVLHSSIPVFVRLALPFKFSLDRRILLIQNSKRYPRGASGKFITAYPATEAAFADAVRVIAAALEQFDGPYILSDRRYGANGIVYYRYGGMLPGDSRNLEGEPVHYLMSPLGEQVVDTRGPEFAPPEWAPDPFASASPEPDEGDAGTLRDGRYRVQTALSFSNSGGVYLCEDSTTGGLCVVKEARPHTNIQPDGADATVLLTREYATLGLLADLGVTPRPIEFFREWEHVYLAEEHRPGIPLRSFWSERALFLNTRPTQRDVERFLLQFAALTRSVARAIIQIHERGLVFGDLSPMNVLVEGEGERVTLIDLEAAVRIGTPKPPALRTPGFADPRADWNAAAEPADDLYALGAILLSAIAPVNWMLGLDPGAAARFLPVVIADLGLPAGIEPMILGLLGPVRADRSSWARAAAEFVAGPCRPPGAPGVRPAKRVRRGWLEGLVSDAVRYIKSTADYHRRERLFPADPKGFITNHLGLAFGASGVLLALSRIDGQVAPSARGWLRRALADQPRLPPGLFVGSAGIAWAAAELGMAAESTRQMEAALAHRDWRGECDLAYGAAGCGMAALKVYGVTGERRWLEAALDIGSAVASFAERTATGLRWTAGRPQVYGLAHGAAGVGLFLLYLHLASGEGWCLNVAKGALDEDLAAHWRSPEGGWTWRISENNPTRMPYWRYGSAGVGIVVARFAATLGERGYAEALRGICIDANRKFTIFPGMISGLAGIGQFWLDLEALFPGRGNVAIARRVADGIRLFGIRTPQGVAFPGHDLMRISCDLATGGAGIALFLHRLRCGGEAPLMLDALLPTSRSRLHAGSAAR